MIRKSQKNQKLPYLKDFEVYALWKYLNGNLTGRKVFQFADLQAPKVSKFSIANFIAYLFDQLGVKLEKPVFNKDIYWQFHNKKKDVKEVKRILRIPYGDFNILELKKSSILLGKYNVLEFMEFEKNLTKKNRDLLTGYFDFYINQFMSDSLAQNDSNYLKFEVQKQKTLELINNHKTKYGNEFVLKYEPADDEFSPYHDTYLFIHSIVALEKLKDIEVNEAWYYDDIAPDKQTKDFKIQLTVVEPKGIKQRVTKPKLKIEKGIGYFKFYKEGLKIKIGKTESRQYRLIEVLIDQPGTAKTINTVFEAIVLPKDEEDQRLCDDYLAKNRKIEIINFTMKELQKIEGLTGKISLKFYDNKNNVALKLIC